MTWTPAAPMADGLRLAIGTLTIWRVRPPRQVDRSVGRAAMLWAPLVGFVMGGLAEVVVAGTRFVIRGTNDHLLAAAVGIATMAWFSRGLHLDGLVDTADALASGKSGADAQAVMKQPTVGALGVATLVLVLVLQTSGLYVALQLGHGTIALVGGATVSRLALTWTCRPSLPAARPDGLGALVAGTVKWWWAVPSTVVVAIALDVGAHVDDDHVPGLDYVLLLALAVALLVGAGWYAHRIARRLGGISGDVLGAVVEVTFTAFVIATSLPHWWFHHFPFAH
jgi:adenosylcobinamide-GDP ribazoletransferase